MSREDNFFCCTRLAAAGVKQLLRAAMRRHPGNKTLTDHCAAAAASLSTY
jgi:hypothetical protein